MSKSFSPLPRQEQRSMGQKGTKGMGSEELLEAEALRIRERIAGIGA